MMTKKDKAAEKTERKAEKQEAVKEQKKPAPKKPQKPQVVEKENFRGIIRIAGKDMKGELPLRRALSRVRGIGHTLAVSASIVLQDELSLNPSLRIGELTEEQIEKIDHILNTLQDRKVAHYLLNRRGDVLSGKDRHVIMNDLIFENTQDVERDKKMYTWRGYRHSFSQKVRGQRTRNTGRSGMAVGVLRKAIVAAQAAAKAPAGGGAGAPAAAAAAAKPAEKKAAPAAEKK